MSNIKARFRFFTKGEKVYMTKEPVFVGVIKAYIGYKITPTAKGRVYRVKWTKPTVATSDHFDWELSKVEFKLTSRPEPA